MNAQEYLDTLIQECKIYIERESENKKEYSKMFPDSTKNSEVTEIISNMSEEDLMKYFSASQGIMDSQTVFMKIASYIYFCKNINIELDIDKLSEVERLTEFVSAYEPFSTEYIISENNLKEKNEKKFKEKFSEFKKSLKVAIKMVT